MKTAANRKTELGNGRIPKAPKSHGDISRIGRQGKARISGCDQELGVKESSEIEYEIAEAA